MEEHNAIHIEEIKSKLEKYLGKETSDLVFKTLRLVYKMDEGTIISSPKLVEEKLTKMLGPSVTDIIFKNR